MNGVCGGRQHDSPVMASQLLRAVLCCPVTLQVDVTGGLAISTPESRAHEPTALVRLMREHHLSVRATSSLPRQCSLSAVVNARVRRQAYASNLGVLAIPGRPMRPAAWATHVGEWLGNKPGSMGPWGFSNL